jgi:hypothetical protein
MGQTPSSAVPVSPPNLKTTQSHPMPKVGIGARATVSGSNSPVIQEKNLFSEQPTYQHPKANI